MPPLFIVTRPQPEADTTAALVRQLGFRALVSPLLRIHALDAPPLAVLPDALLLTSARTAALAAAAYPALLPGTPTYAVGRATAAAAHAAGFTVAGEGGTDGQAALALASGHRAILHLRGEEGTPLAPPPGIELSERLLYRAEAVAAMPEAAEFALRHEPRAAVLLFSPRTARLFADLADAAGLERDRISLVALSPAVAAGAGPGWARMAIASSPSAAQCVAAAAALWQEVRP
jgi:uroporphyrinogen-III synthase